MLIRRTGWCFASQPGAGRVQSRKFEGRNVQGSGSKKAFQEAPRGTHRPSTPETRRRGGACILDAARRLFFVEKTRVASKGNDAETGSDADQGRREALCGAGDRDHSRLSADEAPRSRYGHVPRYGNGSGEHGGVHGVSELCSSDGPRYQAVQVERRQARNIAGLVMMKRWRSLW